MKWRRRNPAESVADGAGAGGGFELEEQLIAADIAQHHQAGPVELAVPARHELGINLRSFAVSDGLDDFAGDDTEKFLVPDDRQHVHADELR